jgi:hypothetical protein
MGVRVASKGCDNPLTWNFPGRGVSGISRMRLSRYLQSAGGKRRSREGPWICEAFAFPNAGVMKEGPVGPSWAYPGPSGTPVSVTRQLAGDGPAGPYRTPMPAVAAMMVAARFKVTRASPGTGS